MVEIERKFLVKSQAFKKEAKSSNRIVQGFLNTNPLRTVRVRVSGDKGFITVKGKGNQSGTTRFEWEKEIPMHEVEALIPLCEPGVIDKKRYFVEVGEHVFEVDEFFGDNAGLIVAEIELNHEEEAYTRPDWLGEEVTNEVKYYNSQLSKIPFKTW